MDLLEKSKKEFLLSQKGYPIEDEYLDIDFNIRRLRMFI